MIGTPPADYEYDWGVWRTVRERDRDKYQTRQILELARRKVYGCINQWQIIMIISTDIPNIAAKFWTDSFVAVNLHPHHRMTFPGWIKKISPAVKTGETTYFQNHEGSYYDAMPSVCENMCVPIQREVMCIIYLFFKENPPGKSPRKKEFFSIVCFFLLTKYPRSIYAIWWQRNILR